VSQPTREREKETGRYCIVKKAMDDAIISGPAKLAYR
jgi:hypothetical protein